MTIECFHLAKKVFELRDRLKILAKMDSISGDGKFSCFRMVPPIPKLSVAVMLESAANISFNLFDANCYNAVEKRATLDNYVRTTCMAMNFN